MPEANGPRRTSAPGVLRVALAIFATLLLTCALAAAEPEIAVVQSVRVKPYEAAIEGFRSVCGGTVRRIVLSDSRGPNPAGEIRRIRPDLVLAVGKDALLSTREIDAMPIVYAMVLNPEPILAGRKNITGVSMRLPPEKQLMALLKALPDARRIGLLYDPARSRSLVREAGTAAGDLGIELVARAIHRPQEAPSAILSLKGKVDAFWMIPDLTVMTPETVEYLVLFSLENRLPLLAFSEKYLSLGAFMSVGVDAFDMGVQAGELANRIIFQRDLRGLEHAQARRMVVSTNLLVAGKLGIYTQLAGSLHAEAKEGIIRDTWKIQ